MTPRPHSKRCFKCGEVKPLDEFYRHPMMGDGHLNKCKECTKADVRRNRIDNIELVREYDRKRNQLPHRKALREANAERWEMAHPNRKRAHGQVHRALRSGRLTKQPCEVCGDVHVVAHHDDYGRPLDVRWLCQAHHLQLHANMAMEGSDEEDWRGRQQQA